MYLMYVDESGDTGLNPGASKYFVLSGLVVHETSWRAVLDRIIQFRKRMKSLYGLRQRDEIHAAQFINGQVHKTTGLRRDQRLNVLRAYIKEISQIPDIRLIHILVDKNGKLPGTDIFELAWKALIQRFENTLQHKNFPGSSNPVDHGIIFPDDGNIERLKQLLRKMRVYNPIPNRYPTATGLPRNLPLRFIVEDPVHRDSRHSYFVQSVDVTAYFLTQLQIPNKYVRQKGAGNYFLHLAPVVCKPASPGDPLGIVRL